MALDILQVAQSVPQQFIPYIILFGLVFFLVSFTKISWKIRLVVALVASVGVNIYMPTLLSPLTSLLNSIASIGASLILIAVGFLVGRKHASIQLPAVSKQSQGIVKNLETRKSLLVNQLSSVHGDANKERQISAQIGEINDRIRKERARLGLSV